jgi:uncharacterized protein
MSQTEDIKTIIEFINTQKCLSLCCIKPNGLPYCFSCYFAFNSDEMLLYFKSSSDTNHIEYLKSNQHVAGTILPDKLKNLVVQGIQFEGKLILDDAIKLNKASKIYHIKYPFAIVMPGEVWTIEIETIKMTDSTKGFGTKLYWTKENVVNTN